MSRSKTFAIALCSATVLGAALVVPARSDDPVTTEYRSKVRPLLNKYCVSCHSGKEPAGSYSLDKPLDPKSIAKEAKLWERFIFNVKSLSMPPTGAKPTDAERLLMVEWAQKALAANCDLADAGKVTIRRLNRREYDNSIRDLLGIDLKLSEDFPSDDVGEGFDNIGDVLTLSPLHLEKYLAAAEKAANSAIKLPKPSLITVDLPETLRTDGCRLDEDNGLVFFAASTASAILQIPENGDYRLVLEAWQQKAGSEDSRMIVLKDNKPVDEVTIKAGRSKPAKLEIPLQLGKGNTQIALRFSNDYYNPQDPDPNNRDRNLFVRKVELVRLGAETLLPNGPITALPKNVSDVETPTHDLVTLAAKAYRRPLKDVETAKIQGLYSKLRKSGASFEQAMRDCVAAILTSPSFLFREESVGSNGLLGQYETASRLSYFLWGSVPDQALATLASQGRLHDPKVLSAEVTRMLQLSKASNLGEDFAVQWLQLRKLENVSPDPTMFPDFNDDVRRDMQTEAQVMFMDAVRGNRSVLDLLDSKEVFVNERLAKVYGLKGVTGSHFRKVQTQERGGLLAMAGVLTVTSNPNRTSPVKRGKWVLENILGAPPPPPAPDVGILIDDTAIKPTLPMKERLALHRKKPECATCHTTMDSIGFALENYDPIGRWRTKDGDFTVDSKATLPDGKSLAGAQGLKKFVLARKKDFVRCLAEKMLVYATGRGLRPQDSCHVTTIVDKTVKGGYKMQALIQAVVQSDPFRKRSL